VPLSLLHAPCERSRRRSTPVLEKVCQYLYYNAKYSDAVRDVVPAFDIEPAMLLELLMASNFLEC
jgi:hypothetical protein